MSRPASGPDSSQHVKLSSAKALLRLVFQCRRNFKFMACFKVKDGETFNEQEGTTSDISLFLDLMMWKVATTSMSVFRNFDCLSLVVCSNTILLKLQTVLFLFFSKFRASKSGVRLIYGCGLYTDVYGNLFKKKIMIILSLTIRVKNGSL